MAEKYRRMTLVGVTVLVTTCLACRTAAAAENDLHKAYRQLLGQFSIERPGFGPDSHFDHDTDQAMTYGLVLWSEANRYASEPTDDGKARIRAAAEWLHRHRDLDGDGHSGWGLPREYDTWNDGSINPVHTPYTITTALCLLGLIEAAELPDVWTADEQSRYRTLVKETVLHWTRLAWTEGYGGGFFWYSPHPNDHIYCVNPSSMMLAALVATLVRQEKMFTVDERALLHERADETLKALIANVSLRDGAPYWRYAPLPNRINHDKPNDAVHQAYTLWGIEAYRDHFKRVKIPWPRSKSLESLDRYVRDCKPYALPQDVAEGREREQLDRLWGRGMVLAFHAKWGRREQAMRTLEELKTHYGRWPRLKQRPGDPDDAPFFPRQAAHVLLGLSLLAYP